MGEYVYTLRKKTIKTKSHGKVYLFSYLMKPHYDLTNKEKMWLSKAEKVWQNDTLPKYVVNGSMEYFKQPQEKKKSHCYYSIYENPTSHVWWDCGKFPATHVGYIEIYNGKAHSFLTAQEFNNLCNNEQRNLI